MEEWPLLGEIYLKEPKHLNYQQEETLVRLKDLANPNDVFFNISEYGVEAKLSFPRIVFPINTKSIIKRKCFLQQMLILV